MTTTRLSLDWRLKYRVSLPGAANIHDILDIHCRYRRRRRPAMCTRRRSSRFWSSFFQDNHSAVKFLREWKSNEMPFRGEIQMLPRCRGKKCRREYVKRSRLYKYATATYFNADADHSYTDRSAREIYLAVTRSWRTSRFSELRFPFSICLTLFLASPFRKRRIKQQIVLPYFIDLGVLEMFESACRSDLVVMRYCCIYLVSSS